MTLQKLAKASAVSSSTIHKIENGQTIPTIAVILKLAHGLGRRPSEIFEGDQEGVAAAVTRADERDDLETIPGVRLQRVVGGIPGSTIDLWRATFAPGLGSDPEKGKRSSYKGELIILIESGFLHVEVADESFDLGPADTIHFKTSTSHLWVNEGREPVSALLFGSLPKLALNRPGF